nr:protein S-acyltransferase 18 [Tanacetum cinerariifolium]
MSSSYLGRQRAKHAGSGTRKENRFLAVPDLSLSWVAGLCLSFAGSVTTYGSTALGKLFLFHVILVCKGMRTFDYIMAMKEENALVEEDMSEDYSDISSDEILDLDSPEKQDSPFVGKEYQSNENGKAVAISEDSTLAE